MSILLALALLPTFAIGAADDDAAYRRRLEELTATARRMTPGNLVKPEGADRDARPYLARLAADVALPGREFIYVLHLVGAPSEEERPALTGLLGHPDTLVRQNASLALAAMRHRGMGSLGELMSAARRSAGKEQWLHVRAMARIAPAARETWDLLLEAHASSSGAERRALERELALSVLNGNRDRAALAAVADAARRAGRRDGLYADALDRAAGRAPRATRRPRPVGYTWSLPLLWPLLGIAGGLAYLAFRTRRPAPAAATSRGPLPPAPALPRAGAPAPTAAPSAPRPIIGSVTVSRGLLLAYGSFIALVVLFVASAAKLFAGGFSWQVRFALVALPLLPLTSRLTRALRVDSWTKALLYVVAVAALSGTGAAVLPGGDEKMSLYTEFVHRRAHPSVRVLDAGTERWLDSTRFVVFTIDEEGFEEITRSGVYGGTFRGVSGEMVAPLVERLSSHWKIASPLRDGSMSYWLSENGRIVLARRKSDGRTYFFWGNRYDKIEFKSPT